MAVGDRGRRTGAHTAGAAGYVLKQLGSCDLIDTICRAGAGQSLLDPALTGRVLARLREGPRIRQIAETMFLAENTVKSYVSNLLAKLGMQRRTQAATFAARLNERSSQKARSPAGRPLRCASVVRCSVPT